MFYYCLFIKISWNKSRLAHVIRMIIVKDNCITICTVYLDIYMYAITLRRNYEIACSHIKSLLTYSLLTNTCDTNLLLSNTCDINLLLTKTCDTYL